MDVARVARIVDAQATQRKMIEDRVLQTVLNIVSGFDGWYSPEQIAQMTAHVVAYIEAGQVQVGALTNAYLSQVAREITGQPHSSAAPLVDPTTVRNATAHADAYERLTAQYRYLVSTGMDPTVALAAVQTRAKTMVTSDVALHVRRQARGWMHYHNWRMFRRVVRPERSFGGVCGLCLVASDRLYYRGDLMPIHDNCHCEPILVTRRSDPGSILNRDTLDEIYDDAGSTYANDLIDVKYRIEEHGELGPILVDDRHHFRDAREALALTTH